MIGPKQQTAASPAKVNSESALLEAWVSICVQSGKRVHATQAQNPVTNGGPDDVFGRHGQQNWGWPASGCCCAREGGGKLRLLRVVRVCQFALQVKARRAGSCVKTYRMQRTQKSCHYEIFLLLKTHDALRKG